MKYRYLVKLATGKSYAVRVEDVGAATPVVAVVELIDADQVTDDPSGVDFSAATVPDPSLFHRCRPVDAAWLRLRLTHGHEYALRGGEAKEAAE